MSILHKDNNGVIREFTSGDSKYNLNYSTDETDTGMTWIDGKKIYRKVFEISSLPNSATGNYPHGISNLNNIINCSGFYYIDEGLSTFISCPISGAFPLNGYVQYGVIIAEINNTNISIYAGTDRSGYSGFVILEYTKTTD